MEIGKALKAKREALGLSIGSLSTLSGVSRAEISRVERGERGISVRFWERLAAPLGLNIVIQDKDGDKSFEELKSHYNLPARLVKGIRTVETTQKDKPLQVFDNPNPGRDYHIKWETPELTSLCPKTGQPDFCHLFVDYIPDKLCLELKSAKLYLWSYRQEGHFYENLINLIYSDFWEVIKPKYLEVTGRFAVRGGFVEEVEVSSDTV